MDGEGKPLARERGREGVLPRLLLRRPQELPRREVLPPPQEALALKKPKVEHYDRLETRAPKSREAALMLALPKLIAHAKKQAPGFARILEKINPQKNQRRARRSPALPVTRKSDLQLAAEDLPPLGGLNATPVEKLGQALHLARADLRARRAAARTGGARRAACSPAASAPATASLNTLRLSLHAGRLDDGVRRARARLHRGAGRRRPDRDAGGGDPRPAASTPTSARRRSSS